MPRIIYFAMILFGMFESIGHCQDARSKMAAEVFKVGVKLLTGATAAESMRRAGNSSVEYMNAARRADLARQEYERVRRRRINGVIQQFRSQGLPDDQTAIYSIFLNIDYNATSVYWADTFSNPDVFFLVEVEGMGEFVLPSIRNEYKGGPVLDRIILPPLRPGTRVVVRVLDDDTNGNEIWNSILRSKVNYRFTIDGASLAAGNVLRARADLHGGFQVLETPKPLVLDGPDQLATIAFQIPDVQDKSWVADGELRDSDNRPAGQVQFSQVWNTNSEIVSLERELETRVAMTEREAADSFGRLVFWVVVGIVCLTLFYKSFSGKQQQLAVSKPTHLSEEAF